jgi:hypothetical protein
VAVNFVGITMAVHSTRIERDTLGVTYSPRCLHADVLDACTRALDRSLAVLGRSAEAPRAPDSPAPPAALPVTRAAFGVPIPPAQVAQARAEVARCACGGAPGAAGEAAAVAAAEAAWLPLTGRKR